MFRVYFKITTKRAKPRLRLEKGRFSRARAPDLKVSPHPLRLAASGTGPLGIAPAGYKRMLGKFSTTRLAIRSKDRRTIDTYNFETG